MSGADTIFACLDGLGATDAIVDGALWAARRVQAPLTLLHTLARPEPLPPVGDYSGVIGMGAQDILMQRLNTLDEERVKLAQEAAERMLASASARIADEPLPAPVQTLLRQGELTEVLLENEATARLFVLGSNRRPGKARKLRLDHNVESVVRNIRQPVMVVSESGFTAPGHFVIAYDASATSQRAVEVLARSPLLRGMPGTLVMVGDATPETLQRLEDAQAHLVAAGFEVGTRILPGLPEEVIPALLQDMGDALLVLGAYGHSRIRQLIVGSTTTALLRLSSAPVLVLR